MPDTRRGLFRPGEKIKPVERAVQHDHKDDAGDDEQPRGRHPEDAPVAMSRSVRTRRAAENFSLVVGVSAQRRIKSSRIASR